MNVEKTTDELIKELIGAIELFRERARTDKSLRHELLADPMPALKRENIFVAPGLKVRFYETGPGELAIPLPPYEGKD